MCCVASSLSLIDKKKPLKKIAYFQNDVKKEIYEWNNK